MSAFVVARGIERTYEVRRGLFKERGKPWARLIDGREVACHFAERFLMSWFSA